LIDIPGKRGLTGYCSYLSDYTSVHPLESLYYVLYSTMFSWGVLFYAFDLLPVVGNNLPHLNYPYI